MGVSSRVGQEGIQQIRNGIRNIVQYFLFEGSIPGDGRGQGRRLQEPSTIGCNEVTEERWYTVKTSSDNL